MNCTFKYRDEVYNSIDELYPVILANMESKESLIGKTTRVNDLFEPTLPTKIIPTTTNQTFTVKKAVRVMINPDSANPKKVSYLIESKENPLFKLYAIKISEKEGYTLITSEGVIIRNHLMKKEGLDDFVENDLSSLLYGLNEEQKNLIGYTNTEKQRQIIAKIEAKANNLVLDPNLNEYVNLETGQRYQRVSHVISGVDNGLNEHGEVAVMFGNQIDSIFRDVMNGSLRDYSFYKTTETSTLFKNEETFNSFVRDAKLFKEKLLKRGETPIQNGGKEIILYDNETGIAGAVDLMTVDIYGNVRIYDYKSMKGNRFVESYPGENVPMIESTAFGKQVALPNAMSSLTKYTKQQSFYKALFEKSHNIPVTNVSLVPIELNKYDLTDTTVKYAEVKKEKVLTSYEIDLSKIRPEVNIASKEEFFKNYTPSAQDLQDAQDYLDQTDIRTFNYLTAEGEKTFKFYIEDEGEVIYETRDEDGKTDLVEKERILPLVAASLAYKKLEEKGIDSIQSNTINSNVPVTINLPVSQDEIDNFLETPLPERDDTEAIVKANKNFIYNYAQGDRIPFEALPSLLDSFTAGVKNPAQGELLKLVINNVKGFENVPIILDTNLADRGALGIDTNTYEITAIRINPNLIKNPEAFRTVLLEELAHVISYKTLKNKNNVNTKRLEEFRKVAIEAFGKDKFNEMAAMTKELANLKIKRVADALTEEEQERYNELVNNPDMAIYYRLSNLDEFTVGLFLSANLQEFLNSIDDSNPGSVKAKSIWDKVVDFITKLLPFFENYNPILKLSLYDAFTIFEKNATSYANNPELLDVVGSHRKSIGELNGLFNLRDASNNLNKIENAAEVADFININVFNVIAEHDEATKTIKLSYRGGRKLRAGEDTDEFKTAEDESTEDRLSREDGFQGKIKSYIINLKQRENTLKREIAKPIDSSLMTAEEYRAAAVKKNKLQEELETVKELRQNVIGRGDVNVNNLYKLSEQAFGELDNIRRFLSKNMNETDLIYAFQTVKFWLKARDLMFDSVDITDEGAISRFNEVEKKATVIEGELVKSLNDYVMNEVVNKKTSNKDSLTTILQNTKDLDRLSAEVADLGTIKSPIMQAIGKVIKENDVRLSIERADRLKVFNNTLKNAKKSLKHYSNGKDAYEIFRQVDELGNKTRNLVSRFSNKYAKDRRVLNFVYTSQDKTKEEAYEAFKFLQENTEAVDLNKLFPFDEVETEETINELNRVKDLLGEAYFDEWYAKQQRYIKSYKEDRLGYVISLSERYGITEDQIPDNEAASNALSIWESRNSPYRLTEMLTRKEKITANPFGMANRYNSFKYVVDIPKREITDASGSKVPSGYYDAKFERIEKDPALNALYTEMQNILQYVGSLIPFDSAEHLANGQLPEFQKTMYEALLGNMKSGLKTINESLVDMIRTEQFDTEAGLDIVTGKDKKNIRLGIRKSDSLITRDLISARLDHFVKTGTNFTAEEELRVKSEITAKYAEEMDFDLGSVFNKYLQLGLAYEYKAKVEDSLVLSQMMLEEQQEYKRDNKGQLKRDTSINAFVAYQKNDKGQSFTQYKRVLDHTLNSILYGDKRNINSTKTKKYSTKEKQLKAKYEQQLKDLDKLEEDGTLTSEEVLIFKKKLNKYIADLGAYGDLEKYVDLPIKWTQYKGMGWNWLGGISNMMFGSISNLVESAGEQFYTQDELMSAYKTVMQHSVVRNATFNKGGGNEALKIRSLMDTYDIMSESSKEYQDLIGDDFTKNLKFASAFNINQRTEYINQAPLMLVMFRKTTFEHEGKQVPLYQGFNIDGSWNEDTYGPYPEEQVVKTVLKIKALIQRNHGNYNPLAPMLAKRTGVGRLLLQFRSWMVDGYRVRFGDRYGRQDEIFETEVRGRYHSLVDVMKNDWKGISIPLVKQLLYNFIPFKSNMGMKTSPLSKYFEGHDTVREVDVANMKRVAMELNLLIGVYVVGMTLSLLAGDMDDDDPKKHLMNLLLNQSTRMRTDLLMYANPNEAAKLINDPVPALKIISDAVVWTNAVNKTLQGSPDYESGIFEGHNRVLRTTMLQLPFFSQPYRTASSMWQEFE